MTTQKKPRSAHPTSVSRLLGSNPRFRRSDSSSSRIRGLRNTSSGFAVFSDHRGTIVGYRIGWMSMADSEAREQRTRARIAEYAEFLREYYDVISYGNHLLVKEKSE